MKAAALPLLDYRVRKPKNSDQSPQILFLLHGYGSHEEDLFGFAEYLPAHFLIISLRAPLSLPFGGYAWYSIHFNETQDNWSDTGEAIEAQKIILHNIDYHCKQFGLDNQKVNLLGFSQGAILSWALGLSHPEKIDRLIALSGYINEDIFTFAEKSLSNLRCFTSHGMQDATLPIAWAQEGIKTLQAHGMNIKLHEYPAGHGVAPDNFSDLLKWLNENP